MPISDLVTRFQDNLKQHNWLHKKIIVAISGGLDSMVLATLLCQTGAEIELAHCNFHLRAEESDSDEQFVRAYAGKMGIPLHARQFDTLTIQKEQGGNLEEIARDLRYHWFENLRIALGFDLVAVAHHQQDSIETLLINFFKGTGISGMHGILSEQGCIIRPLLPFTKEALAAFALNHQISWREDSSNASSDFLRNKIRHYLLPAIESVFPQAKTALIGNIERMKEIEMLYRKAIETHRKKLLEQRNGDVYISVLKLKKCDPISTILFELLSPFGFSAAQLPDLVHLLDAPSGKWVANERYRLIRDRKFLILTPNQIPESTFISIEKPTGMVQLEGGFGTLTLKAVPNTDTLILPIKNEDHKELMALKESDFPLILRTLREGDYFYPIGMHRKKKKIGKFLRDLKVPLHEKEKVWVMESQNRIVWVVGFRIDERFKVQPSRKDVWVFSLDKKNNTQTEK
jgi:tRNA(Ile)-lysidine synthase